MDVAQMDIEKNSDQIRSVIVRGLFGHFDYDIEIKNRSIGSPPLIILYGENGTGKTTILSLLFKLLAPSMRVGHRRSMLPYRFRSFEVAFASGKSVRAFRTNGSDEGGFDIEFKGIAPKKIVIKFKETDGKPSWPRTGEYSLGWCVERLGFSLYYLPDDRKVRSSHDEMAKEGELAASRSSINVAAAWTRRSNIESNEDRHYLQVKPLFDELLSSFRRQALRGSTTADETASNIYLRVCRQIASLYIASADNSETSFQLASRMIDLNEKSNELGKYGLVASFPVEQFLRLFKDASEDELLAMQKILQPYIEGLEARVNRLQSVYTSMNSFVETINSFFARKNLLANINNGFSFESRWGEAIQYDQLSSGERQLVLLLGNSILAQNIGSSVFIIDEPELSLNVKWQRALVRALLDISQCGVQFIIASHSLELITQFRGSTFLLSPSEA